MKLRQAKDSRERANHSRKKEVSSISTAISSLDNTDEY